MGKAAAQSRTKARQQQKKAAAQRQTFTYLAGGIVVIALLAVVYLISGGGSAVTGQDFSASTLDGQPVQLSDYRGQVVMLNFWATWCPPCRAEMPSIQSAYERHQDDGFVVLAVNNGETAAQIGPFAQSLGLAFPVVLDTSQRIQMQYDITGYPTSIFLSRSGEVFARHSGMISASQLETYIAQGLAMDDSSVSAGSAG